MIALGALGVHGHHVQGRVEGAHRAAREPKIHNVMVEQNAQDPQMIPDHAIQIAANVSKMDGNGHATCGQNTVDISRLFLIIAQAIEPSH